MSEPTPPLAPEGLARARPGTLDPALIEQVLADFRAWLTDLSPAEPVASEPAFELAPLIRELVALRQEVNLQTRSSRAQLEQNAQSLEQLARAVDAIEEPPPSEELRPLIRALVEAYDALALARREVQKQHDALPERMPAAPPVPTIAAPWWARLLGLGAALERACAPVRAWAEQPDPRDSELRLLRQKFDAVLVGYQLSVQRLERVLEEQGLEPIACVGRPFDPEQMEAVEVVRDGSRRGSEVLDEVRRGYIWQGRIFRFAQVRVAVGKE